MDEAAYKDVPSAPRKPRPPTKHAADPRVYGNSRVTNCVDLLPGVKDSSQARRFRDLVNAFLTDLGGVDQCSEIKISLVRRLAASTVLSEQIESKVVRGELIEVATLCTSTSRRCARWRVLA